MDQNIKEQLSSHFTRLQKPVVLTLSLEPNHTELETMVEDIASLSPLIEVRRATLKRTPSVGIGDGVRVPVVFAGTPGGHEFTSLVLGILQQGGVINESLDIDTIQKIDQKLSFVTYFSESCQNCPEVIQALNIMSIANPNIEHVAINGAWFEQEVAEKNILSVPSVFLNDALFFQGRSTLNEILEKFVVQHHNIDCDLAIVGAGPAGISASIYAARKGLRVALIGQRLGGQVLDTLGIENYPSHEYIEGPNLAQQLVSQVKNHSNIQTVEAEATQIEKRQDGSFVVHLKNGTVTSRAVVLAMGARWRDIGVKGEQELRNKGVAYCSHCDGPLFKGKDVAVIGGGNSGIEGALDLSKLVNHVYVLEYANQLKADDVLTKKLEKASNITVITSAQTLEILGEDQVTGLSYLERETQQAKAIPVSGVFVQIGLAPNTQFLQDSGILLNSKNEIVVNDLGQTNIEGVFACGDASNIPFKQIVIAAGHGSVASLSACEYLS